MDGVELVCEGCFQCVVSILYSIVLVVRPVRLV